MAEAQKLPESFRGLWYAPGSLVWAKVRGHSWWPARVLDSKLSDIRHQFKNECTPDERIVYFFGDGQKAKVKLWNLKEFETEDGMRNVRENMQNTKLLAALREVREWFIANISCDRIRTTARRSDSCIATAKLCSSLNEVEHNFSDTVENYQQNTKKLNQCLQVQRSHIKRLDSLVNTVNGSNSGIRSDAVATGTVTAGNSEQDAASDGSMEDVSVHANGSTNGNAWDRWKESVTEMRDGMNKITELVEEFTELEAEEAHLDAERTVWENEKMRRIAQQSRVCQLSLEVANLERQLRQAVANRNARPKIREEPRLSQ